MRKSVFIVLSCFVLIALSYWGLTHFISAGARDPEPPAVPSAAARDPKPSASLSAAAEKPKPAAKRQILFVCTGNYYRSRYAQAFFNLKAEEIELGWTAVSRGLAIDPGRKGISRLAAQELSKRGVPQALCQGDAQPLTEADLNKSDYIVVMDETEHRPMIERRFPKRDDRKIHYWKIPDFPIMSAPNACAAMSENIDHLLKELAGPTEEERRPQPARELVH